MLLGFFSKYSDSKLMSPPPEQNPGYGPAQSTSYLSDSGLMNFSGMLKICEYISALHDIMNT